MAKHNTMRRYIAYAEFPYTTTDEIQLINNRMRTLGENFMEAVLNIQHEIDDGELIMVKEEPILV